MKTPFRKSRVSPKRLTRPNPYLTDDTKNIDWVIYEVKILRQEKEDLIRTGEALVSSFGHLNKILGD